jgi:hypothetical protein
VLFGFLQEKDILLGATVSVYINQRFTWTLSKDPFGEPPEHLPACSACAGPAP